MKHTIVISSLILALLTSGCEVTGVAGAATVEVEEGSYDLLGRSFQNDYGTVEFQDAGQNGVQYLQTCNQSSMNCNSMTREMSSAFLLNLNDSRSYYSRAVGDEYWDSWISGSAEQLTVITQVRNLQGIKIRTVRESFRITDDPCGYAGGRGLEDRYEDSNASRTCQAYY